MTFPKACEIAVAMEMASKKSMEFSGQTEPHRVNSLSSANVFSEKGKRGQFRRENHNNKAQNMVQKGRKNSFGTQHTCYRCGGKHSARDCKFKNEKCHTCSKIGHITCACRKGKAFSQT